MGIFLILKLPAMYYCIYQELMASQILDCFFKVLLVVVTVKQDSLMGGTLGKFTMIWF